MLTFYATTDVDSIRSYMPDVPYLLPASSWARKGLKPPQLPNHISHVAADCGGFVATFRWGDYRYTPDQYVQWLASFLPRWAATMDYCCEQEIATNAGIVKERQNKTTAMAWDIWKSAKDRPWAWVPTIQGWSVEDYQRHALEMKPLIDEMRLHYGDYSEFRVGIGTLCRRASANTIRRVVSEVARILPNTPLHLWGIKLTFLQQPLEIPKQIVSVDSAAWNGLFATGREKFHASGLTQREYTYKIALPEYLAKLDRAINEPKQMMMDLC